MGPLNKINSLSKFVVIIPSCIVLSEHSTFVEAAKGRRRAIGEGFKDAVVMVRKSNGWEVKTSKGNLPAIAVMKALGWVGWI